MKKRSKFIIKILTEKLSALKGSIHDVQLPTSVEVVFQNENYAVINKPPVVLSQPPDMRTWYSCHNYDPVTLLDLLKKNERLETLNENVRPRIIHRIDTCVSGGMVIALKKNAAKMFSRNLRLGGDSGYTIVRKYVAKVGAPSSSRNIRCGLINLNGDLTYFKRVDDEHLVLQLITGRKHQIRRSVSIALKTPIYNDFKYGGEEMFNMPFQIALHSAYVKTRIGRKQLEHLIPVPTNFDLLWGTSLDAEKFFSKNVNDALKSDWSEEIRSVVTHIKDIHSRGSQVYAVE